MFIWFSLDWIPEVLARFLSGCWQTASHMTMILSTRTHKALNHQTGAVWNLTARKKDMFCYKKNKKTRKHNILLRDQATRLYLKRRIDMTVQMQVRSPDLCCSPSQVGSGIFPHTLSLQVSDSLQIRLLATVENKWRCTMLTVQLPTEKVIYHVLHTCLCKHC